MKIVATVEIDFGDMLHAQNRDILDAFIEDQRQELAGSKGEDRAYHAEVIADAENLRESEILNLEFSRWLSILADIAGQQS